MQPPLVGKEGKNGRYFPQPGRGTPGGQAVSIHRLNRNERRGNHCIVVLTLPRIAHDPTVPRRTALISAVDLRPAQTIPGQHYRPNASSTSRRAQEAGKTVPSLRPPVAIHRRSPRRRKTGPPGV